jgi:4-methyl-5(b-hydroxyethyl)-thiazole monophosphate biosynthesis
MVIFCLANGFEELEAIAPIDILRRGGVDVKTVGIDDKTITGAHGIPFICDMHFIDVDGKNIEGVVLPGGMPGTKNLADSPFVSGTLKFAVNQGLIIGAICAAPSVLGGLGLLKGKKATCFPGFEDKLTGAEIADDYVVRDGNFITAKGAGVAAEFGFALLEAFTDKANAEKIKAAMQFRQ